MAPLLANILIGSPTQFLLIAGGVCVLWIALLFVSKSALHSLGSRKVRVNRYIDFEPGNYFEWVQGSEKLGRIENPKIKLFAKTVPEAVLKSGNGDRSWPIWIVVYNGTFSQERIPSLSSKYLFIVETEVTASEASNYPEVPHSVVRETSEPFSPEKALNLLRFADRAQP